MRIFMGVNNSWRFFITFFIILSETFNGVLISALCLNDQSLLLLQVKESLDFDPEVSTKLVSWSTDEDCCNWNGVECDTSGRVIGLELNDESISGGIEYSTILFKLQYLQKLNLANNKFNNILIPSAIADLKNLVHLNLSSAGFGGQIPIEVSYLRKLVSLDLSTPYLSFISNTLNIRNPNLKTLVQNLENLEELYLDEVYISEQRSNWSQSLASSLPRLRILSLRFCGIEGPVDASLLELRSLSVIQLDRNDLSTTDPDFFANFSNLTTLSLGNCMLVGTFPAKIFQVPILRNLDLSFNFLLRSSNDSLSTLGLGNLSNLTRINLSNCNLSGLIPPAMTNLSNLVYLDLSVNSFSGPIPFFQNSTYLTYINLFSNELTGPLSPAHFRNLLNLKILDLGFNSLSGNIPLSIISLPSLKNFRFSNNKFSGNIPSSIFTLPSLNYLDLSNNKFSGKMDEFPNASSSVLETLVLNDNLLNGSIPESIFNLRKLSTLSLSSNSFSGTIHLEIIMNLVNLSSLDLSHNKISVDPRISNPSMLPQLQGLGLASCKLKMFPELTNQSQLRYLDLSDNQIKGEVPNWIWKFENGNGNFKFVNLSFNLLVSLQKPYIFPNNFDILDLHSNHFQGEIPIPPALASYVDYSDNNFSYSIPPDIGNNISIISFFSLANNSLTGSIPESICNATNLVVLDFSDNSLIGKIPSCVVENIHSLSVLNLAKNKLSDSIPNTFPVSCLLQTLDLSSNALRGKIPETLINCTNLEVLNIGNNKLEDTFPCNLKNSSSLRVLVLRSNKLYGNVICNGANNFWEELQIIDISSNNFTGDLTPRYFSGWRRMILDDDNSQFKENYLRLEREFNNGMYYHAKVIVTIKGQEYELVKILKIFTSIDFSNNNFTGKIPDTIGDLRSLYLLNLSHNAFTERIPSSIGKLKSLGSLDLSVNQISGEIPATLASITFLSFFNLSFNKLSGRIPTGPQLQTFTSASYEGNTGLCGWPLNTTCIGDEIPSPNFTNTTTHSKTEIKWEYVSAATGYTVGLASFISVLLLCKSWRGKYFYCVDKILFKIVKQKGGRSIAEQGFRIQAMRRL